MSDLYSRYERYVQTILETNQPLTTFKAAPEYQYMLEHTNEAAGLRYLELLQRHSILTNDEILEFCAWNDSLGGSNTIQTSIGSVTPSSLRYLYHAHLSLTHLSKVNTHAISSSEAPIEHLVEIGGGYGGLALAIGYLSTRMNRGESWKIKTYNIVDLPNIIKLQRKYIDSVLAMKSDTQPFPFPIVVHSSEFYGDTIRESPLFCISNYCFSEISNINQKRYLATLFPSVKAGFMTWNMIPLYNIGYSCTVEDEDPQTGSMNKYVSFTTCDSPHTFDGPA